MSGVGGSDDRCGYCVYIQRTEQASRSVSRCHCSLISIQGLGGRGFPKIRIVPGKKLSSKSDDPPLISEEDGGGGSCGRFKDVKSVLVEVADVLTSSRTRQRRVCHWYPRPFPNSFNDFSISPTSQAGGSAAKAIIDSRIGNVNAPTQSLVRLQSLGHRCRQFTHCASPNIPPVAGFLFFFLFWVGNLARIPPPPRTEP